MSIPPGSSSTALPFATAARRRHNRVVSESLVTGITPEIEDKIGFVGFTSRTIRAFKLPMEDRCEDFGQITTYHGTIAEHPHAFDLDDHHRFHTGKPTPVCGNTADMLSLTRYATHFDVTGAKEAHYGQFGCGPQDRETAATASGCC